MTTGYKGLLILACCVGCLISCETPQIGSGEDADKALLEGLRAEILAAVDDLSCTETKDCRYVGLGAKPCGGPWEWVIYSDVGVDGEALSEAVREFNKLNQIANNYYGWTSDCTVVPEPLSECVENICTDVAVKP